MEQNIVVITEKRILGSRLEDCEHSMIVHVQVKNETLNKTDFGLDLFAVAIPTVTALEGPASFRVKSKSNHQSVGRNSILQRPRLHSIVPQSPSGRNSPGIGDTREANKPPKKVTKNSQACPWSRVGRRSSRVCMQKCRKMHMQESMIKDGRRSQATSVR